MLVSNASVGPVWLLIALAALAVGWLANWVVFARRKTRMQAQLVRSEQLQSAAEREKVRLLSQVDGLRAELKQQRGLLASTQAKVQAKTSEDSERWREVQAMNDLFVEPRASRKRPDFEDTQVL